MTEHWAGILDEQFTFSDEDVARIKALMDGLPDGTLELNHYPLEHPMPAPKSKSIATSGLDFDVMELQVEILTDGRRTEAIIGELYDHETYLAAGVAVRRKTEKPKQDAATALALGRAFRDLAEGYFKLARVNGLPEAKR